MRFGGHESFVLRSGWLTKGMFLVSGTDSPGWNSISTADQMGVGRNMSKSIGWWMGRTGLAQRPQRHRALELTPLGKRVLEHYPYLAGLVPWWFVHLNLTLGNCDTVFHWFFHHHREKRFTREILEGALVAYLESTGKRVPAAKTLHRDIAVLLQSYSRSIPAQQADPEDNLECPMRGLGLLVHRSDIGVYERRATGALIPPAVIAAALDLSTPGNQPGEKRSIPLDFSGPVRSISAIFGMDAESMTETIIQAIDQLGPEVMELTHLSGQRSIVFEKRSLDEWLDFHAHMQFSAPDRIRQETG